MHPFPRLRWLAPAWLAVYVPSYAVAYGWTNFLFLCNVGVVVGSIGLWRGSRLWLSTGGVASLAIGSVWAIDFFGRLLLSAPLLGVTDYMWDPQFPLFTRTLSLYHVAWPALTLVCLRRIGYDPRAWPVQAMIGIPLIVAGRFVAGPAENINYAWTDPVWGIELGPPVVHLATVAAATVFVLYGISHHALGKLAGEAEAVADGAEITTAEPA